MVAITCADCNEVASATPEWEANHVCPSDAAGNLPKVLVWLTLWLCGVALMLGVLVAGLFAYDAIADPQEDDLFANCHILGDGNCGSSAPWHGFINMSVQDKIVCENGFRVEPIDGKDHITCGEYGGTRITFYN